jgi:3-hydroxymyristoyl/3-hydroxydecanoyl-(acyl carrier protein) dehydratase
MTSGKNLPNVMSQATISITDLIPQRAPFIMIDQVIHASEEKTITSFHIKEDNILCQNGFFREPGMIENMAQSVAAIRGLNADVCNQKPQIGYIGSVKNFKAHSFPAVNTTIKTEIRILSKVLNFTSISGKIFADDQLAAECELVIAVSSIETGHDS